jgi:Fic-DOC domain mobile mystery protein B
LIVGFTDFGQTPLNPDELQGLIPPWITTHAELNLAEQANIIEAEAWCFAPRARREISELFANRLHRRMFAQVWSWAGTYRKSDKNLGCVFYEIPQQMKSLFDEAQFWAAHATYPPDEIAIRLKHRLVSIHAYANGKRPPLANDRRSRLFSISR